MHQHNYPTQRHIDTRGKERWGNEEKGILQDIGRQGPIRGFFGRYQSTYITYALNCNLSLSG